MTSFLNSITKRKKTPEQLVNATCNSLSLYVDNYSKEEAKSAAEESLTKRLGQIKTLLYGDGKSTEVDEDKALELAKFAITVSISDYIHKMIS
jgi:hypothetical protein